jgi:hypothetical protein
MPGYSGPAAQAESAEPAAAAGLKRVVKADTVVPAVPAVPAGLYPAAVAPAAVVEKVEPLTANRAASVVTAVTAGLLNWPAMAERAVQAVTLEGEPPMTGVPVPVASAGGSSAARGDGISWCLPAHISPVGDPALPFLRGAKKSACLAPR